MDLNQFGSVASIISLFIGIFLGAGITHVYHIKIKNSNSKKNISNTFINTGEINQENK